MEALVAYDEDEAQQREESQLSVQRFLPGKRKQPSVSTKPQAIKPYISKRRRGHTNSSQEKEALGLDAIVSNYTQEQSPIASGNQANVEESNSLEGNSEKDEAEGSSTLPLRLQNCVSNPSKSATQKTRIPTSTFLAFSDHSSAVNTIKWSNKSGK